VLTELLKEWLEEEGIVILPSAGRDTVCVAEYERLEFKLVLPGAEEDPFFEIYTFPIKSPGGWKETEFIIRKSYPSFRCVSQTTFDVTDPRVFEGLREFIYEMDSYKAHRSVRLDQTMSRLDGR